MMQKMFVVYSKDSEFTALVIADHYDVEGERAHFYKGFDLIAEFFGVESISETKGRVQV